ncbi:MAG: DUF971 domain-containing protein [Pseudomonadota bacterium]|nr:DUF971 domain-containing protein [Pseudomonadota bacterium]MEC8516691.1 DUF971 domain-containing protein [Pseudomonadota bacterium]MEC9144894.1 DUF971 domain-containing protein [Pseudomonadota bacterium]MED5312618.1 DUF971 domain-containing protein [Pseudomonadota bacterium]
MTDAPTPSEIRLSADKQTLQIGFESGESFALSAELLRVESPSAEVQGHGASQKVTPKDKENVKIIGIEPVGNYAVRLAFDDGHNTGIFSWDILFDYGRRQDSLMAAYRERLGAS